MDVNELRSVVTLFSLLVFLAIVVWAYSKKRSQQAFDEAAALPLQEDGAGQSEPPKAGLLGGSNE